MTIFYVHDKRDPTKPNKYICIYGQKRLVDQWLDSQCGKFKIVSSREANAGSNADRAKIERFTINEALQLLRFNR